jgi:hypothetical protein
MLSTRTNKTYFIQIYIYTLCTLITILSLQSTCQEHNLYIVLSNFTIAILTHLFCKHDNLKSTMFIIITALCYTLTTIIFTTQTYELNIKCDFYQQEHQQGFLILWSHTLFIIIPTAFIFIMIGFTACFIDLIKYIESNKRVQQH